MIYIRSTLFNLVFYVSLFLFLSLGSPVFFAKRLTSIRALQLWAATTIWWLRVLCNIQLEVRGREHLQAGPLLVAGKHQSVWETICIMPFFNDPCMVMKRELVWIPLFGWYVPKFRMMTVVRQSGSAALRTLLARAKREITDDRQIVIMPEGTRRLPDAPPDYKPGVAALYGALKSPCLPFALNTGLYWPRRKFLRYPGTVILKFLPIISPGLSRKTFLLRLQNEIESASNQLVSEGRMVAQGLAVQKGNISST